MGTTYTTKVVYGILEPAAAKDARKREELVTVYACDNEHSATKRQAFCSLCGLPIKAKTVTEPRQVSAMEAYGEDNEEFIHNVHDNQIVLGVCVASDDWDGSPRKLVRPKERNIIGLKEFLADAIPGIQYELDYIFFVEIG